MPLASTTNRPVATPKKQSRAGTTRPRPYTDPVLRRAPAHSLKPWSALEGACQLRPLQSNAGAITFGARRARGAPELSFQPGDNMLISDGHGGVYLAEVMDFRPRVTCAATPTTSGTLRVAPHAEIAAAFH